MLNVLVACEYSGAVRDVLYELGHNVMSCDLLPGEGVHKQCHYQGDIKDMLEEEGWDLMIAHPPCTHLAVSGARWFKDKQQEQEEALAFVQLLMDAPIPHIAIEFPGGRGTADMRRRLDAAGVKVIEYKEKNEEPNTT